MKDVVKNFFTAAAVSTAYTASVCGTLYVLGVLTTKATRAKTKAK